MFFIKFSIYPLYVGNNSDFLTGSLDGILAGEAKTILYGVNLWLVCALVL